MSSETIASRISAFVFDNMVNRKNQIKERPNLDAFPEEPPFVPKFTPDENGIYHPLVDAKKEITDTSPWFSAGSYQQGGQATYYFQAIPKQYELWWQARNSCLGWRLTYGVAKDTYLNEFSFRLNKDKITDDDAKEFNVKARKHLEEIGYFLECKKACGYKREQGEAILVTYRQGDGALLYNISDPDKVNYQAFEKPTNINKPIIRVEAWSAFDYSIPLMGNFGKAQWYFCKFRQQNNAQQYWRVDPSRVVRWRNDAIDYDFWSQQSALRPCFGELQIVNNLTRSAGVAAHRWAIGVPTFYIKSQEKNMETLKAKLGNPLVEDMWVFPADFIDHVEMNGIKDAGLDLNSYMNMVIDQLSAYSQIPNAILMGKEVGVEEGGVVSERQYFSTLVREQADENRNHRQFIAFDPFFQDLFTEYKQDPTDYELDWGLRQEMSKTEKADLELKEASVAISLRGLLTVDELRAKVHCGPLAESNFADFCESLLAMKAEQIGAMIPELGVINELTLNQLLVTPMERGTGQEAAGEAQLNESVPGESEGKQLMSGENKPGNVIKSNMAKGSNASPATVGSNAANRSRALKQMRKSGKSNSTTDWIEDLATDDIREFFRENIQDMSVTRLAKATNINPVQIRKLYDFFKEGDVFKAKPQDEQESEE
jgi:hypothetical protein